VKLTLQVESSKHARGDTTVGRDSGDQDQAFRRLEDAWRRVNEPGITVDERQRRSNWLGGGIVVFALLTGDDPERVRSRIEASSPAAPTPVDSMLPVFREGRSTPPPPRHPGAQSPVE